MQRRHVSGADFLIGRGSGCDWVLPDPERVVSARHCALEFRGGTWRLRDLSTNGTYLNYASDPVGRDQVAALNNGDRLRLGPYEIEVQVEAEAHAPPDWDASLPGVGTSAGHGPRAPHPGTDDSPFAEGPPMPDHRPATGDAFLPPPARWPPSLLPEDWDADLPPPGRVPATPPRALPDPLGDGPPAVARTPASGDGDVDPPPPPVAKPTPATDPPRLGSILWNPPARMKVGGRERIEVRLGDAEVAVEQLHAGLRGRGAREVDRLEVAPLMRVALIADPADFSILALGTADQHVRPGRVARWDFDATALRSGQRRLRVLVSMRVRIEARDEVVDLPSYEREVRVSVAPLRATGRFCAKNWQWIAGSVAVPAALWAATAAGLLEAGSKYLKVLVK